MARNDREGEPIMIKVRATHVSALLRRKGFNPTSSQGGKRWHGLRLRQIGDTVSIRAWGDIHLEEATSGDLEALREIAELLTSNGYEVSPGYDAHYLSVTSRKA
jgi:hypothetical protein